MLAAGPVRLGVKLLADPEVVGVDRLADLQRLDDPPTVIFAPNHHSHLDTALMSFAVPEPWRSKFVVAAAADYFFDTRVKGVLSALALNAIPIDRESTGRKSSDQLRKLLDTGWSMVIYPEGGRSPDGWGQDFKGGAAYLAGRTGAAVVPVFIDGTGAIFGKGMKRPKPGKTKVVFGSPLTRGEGESTRRFSARIEAAVTMLGDEALTDAWTARRRAAQGASPKLPARSTPAGAGSGRSPSSASSARPACAAASNAAGPTWAEPRHTSPPTERLGIGAWRTMRCGSSGRTSAGRHGSSTCGCSTGCSPRSPGTCSRRSPSSTASGSSTSAAAPAR